jgi:glucose-6-phosphate dehydrogenase assembly protein OpcA
MGVVAEIERKLARQRFRREAVDDVLELRTSTLTHVVWAPPQWLPKAKKVLAGLAERHPSRTIFLIPVAGRSSGVEADAVVKDFSVGGGEVLSEVIELRLRGEAARHPASVVLPLLISDLPAFCRWRGRPDWKGQALAELTDVVDRLVVDSSEWPGIPAAYADVARLFERVAVSDLAWRRTLEWRAALAARWPGIRDAERLTVEGPRADAVLLHGWLRSRLRRDIAFTRRAAEAVVSVRIDGDPVEPPRAPPPSGSELLSAELDTLSRDRFFEAAVRGAATVR